MRRPHIICGYRILYAVASYNDICGFSHTGAGRVRARALAAGLDRAREQTARIPHRTHTCTPAPLCSTMQPALLLHLPLTYFLLQQIDQANPVVAANPVAAAAEKRKAAADAAAAVAAEAGGLQIDQEKRQEQEEEVDQAAAAAQAAAAGGGGSSGGSSSGAGGSRGGASGSAPVAHEQVCHFSRL